MESQTMTETDVRELAAVAARGLREGSLKLRDVLDLTDGEMDALAAIGDGFRRRGLLAEAVAIHSLIITCDPLSASSWRAMADLQRRSKEPAVATACYEVAATLGGRDAQISERQALCLEQMGQPQLARDLRLAERARSEKRRRVS